MSSNFNLVDKLNPISFEQVEQIKITPEDIERLRKQIEDSQKNKQKENNKTKISTSSPSKTELNLIKLEQLYNKCLKDIEIIEKKTTEKTENVEKNKKSENIEKNKKSENIEKNKKSENVENIENIEKNEKSENIEKNQIKETNVDTSDVHSENIVKKKLLLNSLPNPILKYLFNPLLNLS